MINDFIKEFILNFNKILTNLSSSFRRIKALIAFKNSPLQKLILEPSASDPSYFISKHEKNNNNGQPFNFSKINEYNESQKEVILEGSSLLNSINSSKFFFIQGPPGTGKTFTIVGIIKAMVEVS